MEGGTLGILVPVRNTVLSLIGPLSDLNVGVVRGLSFVP